jgi:hypothetical protein
MSGDENGVDITDSCLRYYGTNRIEQREQIEIIDSEHDEVGLLPRRERTDPPVETYHLCPVDRGPFKRFLARDRNVFGPLSGFLEDLKIVSVALTLKRYSHDAKHVSAHG